MDYLFKGISFGGNYSLVNPNGYPEMRGLMTWSINWDVFFNLEFSSNHRPYLDALLQGFNARVENAPLTEIIEDKSGVITVYSNPFNDAIKISFQLVNSQQVSLAILDQTGRIVTQIVANDFFDRGSYEFNWDTSHVPSGFYFYQLAVSSQIHQFKIMKHQ